MLHLGRLANGDYGLQDPDAPRAIQYFEQAHAAGDIRAPHHLSRVYARMVPPKWGEAERWARIGVQDGNRECVTQLAQLLLRKRTVPARDEAVSLLTDAAERQQNTSAMYVLVSLYGGGAFGVQRNPKLAFSYYQRALGFGIARLRRVEHAAAGVSDELRVLLRPSQRRACAGARLLLPVRLSIYSLMYINCNHATQTRFPQLTLTTFYARFNPAIMLIAPSALALPAAAAEAVAAPDAAKRSEATAAALRPQRLRAPLYRQASRRTSATVDEQDPRQHATDSSQHGEITRQTDTITDRATNMTLGHVHAAPHSSDVCPAVALQSRQTNKRTHKQKTTFQQLRNHRLDVRACVYVCMCMRRRVP